MNLPLQLQIRAGLLSDNSEKILRSRIKSFIHKTDITMKDMKGGLFWLMESKTIRVAVLTNGSFAAATPALFEAIGKEIYGLKTEI
ncbi:MAG: hypothetical protein QXR63_02700 [Candidatus Bathyarchaeia archaeon]